MVSRPWRRHVAERIKKINSLIKAKQKQDVEVSQLLAHIEQVPIRKWGEEDHDAFYALGNRKYKLAKLIDKIKVNSQHRFKIEGRRKKSPAGWRELRVQDIGRTIPEGLIEIAEKHERAIEQHISEREKVCGSRREAIREIFTAAKNDPQGERFLQLGNDPYWVVMRVGTYVVKEKVISLAYDLLHGRLLWNSTRRHKPIDEFE